MSINKVILVGNVGKDPVVRYFDKGVRKRLFPLQPAKTYTNQTGRNNNFNRMAYLFMRALAEVAEKTNQKGTQVYIIEKSRRVLTLIKMVINKYITENPCYTLMYLTEAGQTSYPSQQDNTGIIPLTKTTWKLMNQAGISGSR